jgi:acyl-CoA thioesterase
MKTPQEIINIMMKNDSFSHWLGVKIDKIDVGICHLRASVTSEMLNGFRIAHGGISYSLADSALAFASNSRGFQCVSIETSISHVRKVSEGDVLVAIAEEIHRGKTTGVYDVHVKNQHNQTVSLFKGTVFVTEKEW